MSHKILKSKVKSHKYMSTKTNRQIHNMKISQQGEKTNLPSIPNSGSVVLPRREHPGAFLIEPNSCYVFRYVFIFSYSIRVVRVDLIQSYLLIAFKTQTIYSVNRGTDKLINKI